DGRLLAVPGSNFASDRSVRLYDARHGQELLTLRVPRKQDIVGLRFSPDGRQLVATAQDGPACVWHIAGDAGGWSLPEQTEPIAAVGFSADGRRLVTRSGTQAAGDPVV